MPATSVRELLTEERRLFYVACTRARERLVVTAVASAEDDGDQPSRFLAELGVTVEAVEGRPARTLSLAGLVAELRRTAADPETSEALRAAAARRLARLATERSGDRPLVPRADPSTWWGTRSVSRSIQPVRPQDQPVPVSASIVDALDVCPTRWFLAREAGGVARQHQSANVGEMVHALAQRVAAGELPVGPDGVEVLMGHVEKVWDRLEFRTPWSKARELDRIRMALARFLVWHHGNARTLLGVEEGFRAVLSLPDGETVRLDGYADRIELDADGRVVVVDLKTGRTKPTDRSVLTHVQLGLYQLAVDHGAVGRPRGGRRGRGRRAGPARAARGCGPRHGAAPARPGRGRVGARRAARPAPARGLAAADRELPGAGRPALPRLRLRAPVPDQERRVGHRAGGRPVTVQPRRIDTPAHLAAAMGASWQASDQQWAAITAPLSPAVVIAGAGSGKTP